MYKKNQQGWELMGSNLINKKLAPIRQCRCSLERREREGGVTSKGSWDSPVLLEGGYVGTDSENFWVELTAAA